jgi:hypothetical protein
VVYTHKGQNEIRPGLFWGVSAALCLRDGPTD